MSMKLFKALKNFHSPLLGNVVKGDVVTFGEDAVRPLVKDGFLKAEKMQTKQAQPKKAAKK